jgi:hypothetical protein
MLTRLVCTDLGSRWRPLLVNVFLILLYTLLARLIWGPGVASGMPLAMIMISSLDFVQRAAAGDELARSWFFLRALPITPAMIVSVRYVSSLVALVLYAMVALAAAFVFPYVARAVSPGAWTAVIAGGVGLSAFIMAGFNVLYYRLGYRAAMTTLPYLLLPCALTIAVLASLQNTLLPIVTFFRAVARGAHWAVNNPVPAGILVGMAVTGLIAASWLYSAATLARKELL